jgi:hypothetical protein
MSLPMKTGVKPSSILQGYIICTNGLRESEKKVAWQICNRLGGKLVDLIEENVTCLIAKSVGPGNINML